MPLPAGSTYIPKVQQYIEQLAGVSARSNAHPEECVALGAAIQVRFGCDLAQLSAAFTCTRVHMHTVNCYMLVQAALMSGWHPGLSLMEGSSMWTEQKVF